MLNNIRITLLQPSFLILAAGLAAMNASAQEADISGLLIPERISETPSPVSSPEREALVHLRYTVKADGSTSDIEILDGFYNALFADAATKAVATWTYKPATLNGKAIDWLNNEYVMAFRLPGEEEASISPPVMAGYNQIIELMSADKNEQAIEKLEAMLSDKNTVKTLFDHAFLNDALSAANLGASRFHQALAASKRATVVPGRIRSTISAPAVNSGDSQDLLTEDLMEGALRKRFFLSATLNQSLDALETFDRLQSQVTVPADDLIREQAAAIRQRLVSPDALGLVAGLVDTHWSYLPARRIFAVTDVKGQLASIDVHCQRRNAQLAFESDVEWALPDSWGDCSLTFNGDAGTEFTLYEFSE
ncbi:MAG: energy transducer TonB [Pseudomonadales bacterium]|nr:energy transducer TonB [Pseudomonadales bacterium]